MTGLAVLLLFLPGAAPQEPTAAPAARPETAAQDAPEAEGGSTFGRREARHLWNRAGFGAGRLEIERVIEIGPDAFIEELLATDDFFDEPFYARTKNKKDRLDNEGMDEDTRRKMRSMRRREDRAQLEDFLTWWMDRMLEGEEPLRERMTLFWHGHFASSMDQVKDSFEMIRQNQLFRQHALGSFRDLVYAIARDPAMLEYLDNDTNKKDSPNENFARELMELFTLGEGNYTEQDIKEAARAFTGWADRDGRFRFKQQRHDYGEKTVLGVTGDLDGDDVIGILLEQGACRRFLAGKLIRYFEGVEPREARLAKYAAYLGECDYQIAPFLDRLFHDPAFYRNAVVGTRIAGPVDYLVGMSRRLGVEPPARLVLLGTALLGQRLFHPPNVKGWDGGEAWITTSSLIQRGNLAGVILGQVSIDDFLAYDPLEDGDLEEYMGASMEGEESMDLAMDEMDAADDPRRNLGRLRELRQFRSQSWTTRINFTARMVHLEARSDGKMVRTMLEDLLAIEAPADTRRALVKALATEREKAGVKKNKLLSDPSISEPILRGLAHLILSLPEAQLN